MWVKLLVRLCEHFLGCKSNLNLTHKSAATEHIACGFQGDLILQENSEIVILLRRSSSPSRTGPCRWSPKPKSFNKLSDLSVHNEMLSGL